MFDELIALSIWYKYLLPAPDPARGSDFAAYEPGILQTYTDRQTDRQNKAAPKHGTDRSERVPARGN